MHKAEMPHPIIITESGRALVAHHSVLVTEVIDVAPAVDPVLKLEHPPTDHDLLVAISDLYETVTSETCHEALHDAHELKESILENFMYGNMTLHERSYAEKVYRHLIAKIRLLANQLP